MDAKLFVAAKAFIFREGRILLVRESSAYADGTNAGNYDVVGGRISPGEPILDSLLREVKEETGLSVTVGKPFCVNESWPVVRGEQWQIVRVFFVCTAAADDVQLSKDHDDFIWIDPAAFKEYPIIENLAPVFAAYLNL